MKIANSITELIGNTPLVKLNRLTEGLKAEVAVKLEFFNPGSSVKDRIAIAMVEDAEKADAIFTKLMGSEVTMRKSFIQTNAKYVNFEELDI